MPYNRNEDTQSPRRGFQACGSSSRQITPTNNTNLNPYARIVLGSPGTVVYTPVQNDDGVNVTMGPLPAGYILPHEVRQVQATGTTAGITLWTVE